MSGDWGKAGDSAVNSYFKFLGSRPSQADAALQSAEIAKLNAEAGILEDRRNSAKSLAGLIGNIYQDVEAPRQDPSFVGAMPPTAPSPEVVNQKYNKALPELFSNAASLALENPGDLGKIFAAYAASLGATPDQRTNAQMGAGVPYDATQAGTREKFQNNIDTMGYDKTPQGFYANLQKDYDLQPFGNTREAFYANPDNSGYTLSPGAIRLNNQNQQVAQAPFKKGGGMQLRTNPDGTVEFSEEGDLPTLATKSTQNDLQGSQVEIAKYKTLSKTVRELSANENNFGIPGTIKGVGQDATAILGGLSQSLGYKDSNEAVANIRNQAIASGISPDLLPALFDPSLPALQTATDILVFQAASAAANQSGRDLNKEDVKRFTNIVGKPNSPTMTREKFLAKLDVLDGIIGGFGNVNDSTLNYNVTNPPNLGNVYPNEVSQDNSFTKQNGYDVVNESPIAQGFGNIVNSPANQELTPAERAEYEQLMREGF